MSLLLIVISLKKIVAQDAGQNVPYLVAHNFQLKIDFTLAKIRRCDAK